MQIKFLEMGHSGTSCSFNFAILLKLQILHAHEKFTSDSTSYNESEHVNDANACDVARHNRQTFTCERAFTPHSTHM